MDTDIKYTRNLKMIERRILIAFLCIVFFFSLLPSAFAGTGIARWSDGSNKDVRVSLEESMQQGQRVARDGLGNYLVLWKDYASDSSVKLKAQKLNSDGHRLWGDSGVVVVNISNSENINMSVSNLISDYGGGFFVAWSIFGGVDKVQDIFVQKIDSDGRLHWESPGKPICTQQKRQIHPVAVRDGLGGVFLFWVDYRRAQSGSLIDIYGQHINSTGVLQWEDGGRLIAADANPKEDYESYSPYRVSVAPDGAGGSILGWWSQKTQKPRLQHVSSTGSLPWGVAGKELSDVPADNSSDFEHPLVMTTSGTGIWVLFSRIYVTGSRNAWLRKLDVDTGEKVLAQDIDLGDKIRYSEINLAIIPDGAGGCIIAGLDTDDAKLLSLQRYDESGVPQWNSGDPVFLVIKNWGDKHRLVSDAAGGAIVVWQDYDQLTHTFPNYANHVSGTGEILWNSPVIFNTHSAEPYWSVEGNFDVVWTGGGDAVIASFQYNGDTNRIFAQRVGDLALGRQLEVPYYYQADSGWCWAASTAMLLKYYGKDIQPWEIAAAFHASKDADNNADSITNDYLNKFYGGDGAWKKENFTIITNLMEKIRELIDNGKPVYLGRWKDGGHAVVVTGYDGVDANDHVFINDPSGKLVYGEEEKDPDRTKLVHFPMTWQDFEKKTSLWLSLGYVDIIYENNSNLIENHKAGTISLMPAKNKSSTDPTPQEPNFYDIGIKFENKLGSTHVLLLEWDGSYPYSGYKYVTQHTLHLGIL